MCFSHADKTQVQTSPGRWSAQDYQNENVRRQTQYSYFEIVASHKSECFKVIILRKLNY